MNNGQFLKELGGKIKYARQSKGLSVRALGKLCNMDFSNLSRLENGQKDFHILSLKLIAEKLGIEISELLNMP